MRPKLSFEERYRGGFINGAPRKTTPGGGKISAHEKDQLWILVREAWEPGESLGVEQPDRKGMRRWAEQVLDDTLRKGHKETVVKKVYECVRATRRIVTQWMAPRSKDGQCRRCPAEQEAVVLLSTMEVLSGTFFLKLRKVDMVWSRYLGVALEHKLLSRPRGLSAAAATEIRRILDLCVELLEGDVLYFTTPRKGRWYTGRCKGKRKRGGEDAPGPQARAIEHLTAILGSGPDKDLQKYKGWRPIGVDALLFIPVVRKPAGQIRSLEGM